MIAALRKAERTHTNRITKVSLERKRLLEEYTALQEREIQVFRELQRKRALQTHIEHVTDPLWKEYDALGAELRAMGKKLEKANQAVRRAEKAMRSELQDILYLPPDRRNTLHIAMTDPKMSKAQANRALRGRDRFRALVDERWDVGNKDVYVFRTAKKRSFERSGQIHYGASADEEVFIHEMGHVLETRHPEIRQAARDFLKYRTEGEELQRLRDVMPGSAYRSDELIRVDKFMDPYMGKQYVNNAGAVTATEIISMGLEQMARNPIGFFEKDPEYFRFIWSIMHGEIPTIP